MSTLTSLTLILPALAPVQSTPRADVAPPNAEPVAFALQDEPLPEQPPLTGYEALVPLPSVFDFTRGEGWGFALGATIEFESAYDGSDESEIGFEPGGAVQYRTGDNVFFWEGIELGWRGLVDEQDRVLVQLGARLEGGREAADSEDGRLDGLEDQDDELVAMAEVRYGLTEDWRGWIGGRVMGGPSDFGLLGVLAGGWRFGEGTDGTGTELLAFSTFGDGDFVNKDFGVSASEAAASGLAETELDGGYRSTGLTLIHRRYLSDHLQLAFQGGIEFYSSEIADSPISREDLETEVGISLLWHF